MIGDLQKSFDVFIIVCFLSLIVGFAFLIVLRRTVGIVVWGSIILVLLLFLVGGVLCVTKANQCADTTMSDSAKSAASDMKDQAAANGTAVEVPECVGGYAVPDEDNSKALTYIGYVLFGLGALYGLFICCMCNRIKLAVAINKVAADFVGDTKMAIFIPVAQIVVAIIWWVIWIFVAIFLVSQVPDTYIENPGPHTYNTAWGTKTTPGECTNKWPTGYAWKNEYQDGCAKDGKCWMCAPPRYIFDVRFAYAFFSLLWNNAFIIALGQVTIAGACAGWYFTPNSEKGGRPVIRTSLNYAFRYHLGSLAFGSFILAVVQFVRAMMYYLQKQAEANKNAILAYFFKCMQYVIYCFEKCVKFLNKNAYIQIAILGKSFCKSAWNAFMLIIRNAGRIATLGTIGGAIHFIGTFFIMVVTAFLGYLILGAMHGDNVSSVVVPCICYIMVGYVAAKLIMNVFGLAVDTILQCFVANEEMGTTGDFTPETLKGFMAEHKEDEAAEKSKKCCVVM